MDNKENLNEVKEENIEIEIKKDKIMESDASNKIEVKYIPSSLIKKPNSTSEKDDILVAFQVEKATSRKKIPIEFRNHKPRINLSLLSASKLDLFHNKHLMEKCLCSFQLKTPLLFSIILELPHTDYVDSFILIENYAIYINLLLVDGVKTRKNAVILHIIDLIKHNKQKDISIIINRAILFEENDRNSIISQMDEVISIMKKTSITNLKQYDCISTFLNSIQTKVSKFDKEDIQNDITVEDSYNKFREEIGIFLDTRNISEYEVICQYEKKSESIIDLFNKMKLLGMKKTIDYINKQENFIIYCLTNFALIPTEFKPDVDYSNLISKSDKEYIHTALDLENIFTMKVILKLKNICKEEKIEPMKLDKNIILNETKKIMFKEGLTFNDISYSEYIQLWKQRLSIFNITDRNEIIEYFQLCGLFNISFINVMNEIQKEITRDIVITK